ncbi:MAG: O-antigen ligase family protein [Candidatus Daviesbacteria bacterium]|nr:O-antigen ligase family protein [Candidatus Daviesbacteria bacterium]
MEELQGLRKTVNNYLGLIFKIGLCLVILSSFFFFTNLTTEMFDSAKFVVLIIFTGLLLVLLTLKFTIADKVTFVRTPLDIPLILLLVVGIVSTFLSSAPYVALLGNQLKIHGSLVSLAVYILFYFILVNNLKNIKNIRWIFTLTIVASQVLAVASLLTYSGVKILPGPWVHGINFTPTGSNFSTTAILALLIPFIVIQILTSSKPILLILNSLFLLLSGLAIALTGTWATWIGALVALLLTVAAIAPIRQISRIRPISLIGLIGPISLIGLITALSFIPPLSGVKNPIYTQAQNFPREIQLSFVDSWKISVSAFRDSPFWGTGPASFSFDFTNYKPVEFNTSKFWNLRFDLPFNEYLQVLASLGGIGLVALLSLTALFISSAYQTYMTYRSDRSYSESEKVTLAISGLIFFIILALHSATLSVWVIGLLVLASFMVINQENNPGLFSFKPGLNEQNNFKNMFLKIAGNISNPESLKETIRIDALPGILLTIALALVLFAGFFGGKFVLADYYHRLALNAVAENQGIVAYNNLIAAEKLNPYNDVYRTDLAQTNFALANAIATAKAPTEASPSGSLTDQDKQNIQILLQQSISEARTAVTLSPKSAINWEILAMLYRQISGVAQNALVFSLDAYGRAIFQDPLNPNLRVSVGGVYYAVKNYDMAIRFFTDSINLKPDFTNGYYNLSVALRDKGDLTNAQALAEKLLTLIDKSSPDYKTVSDYLDDLKSRVASGSTKESEIQPPASKETGALQQKELPKVVDVGNPPNNIATPSAVKKPNPTPTPKP